MTETLNFIKNFLFGVCVKGEPDKSPSFRSTYPDKTPEFFEWCRLYRVSCLHGKQASNF